MSFYCFDRAKICRGQHCDCRKDVHFRRRLQYCFQEVEAARDDKIRIRKDLRVAKQILKESSADARLKFKKDRFAKRVSSVSNVASSALKSSQQQTSKSATKPESARKRQVISPYISRGVGEAARRVATGNLAPAQVVPVRSSMSTPPRTQRSPLASPARTSSSRKGLLHSLDGVMASHNHLRHSINAVDEDISHWDLKHLQVQAPDLTQYESLEF